MDTAITVAIISGIVTLLGVIINSRLTQGSIVAELKTEFKVAQSVTDTKIEQLTQEVSKHNAFAEKIPVMQHDIDNLKDRVDHLESKM